MTTQTSWRSARITPLCELLSPARLVAHTVRLTVQILLVTSLWRALYTGTDTSAGLQEEQTVTYAVLAVLATRIRGLDRNSARDTVLQHVQQGTIIYWFLRPLAPQRYYCLRAVGDQLYGSLWFLTGYAVSRLSGIVAPPASKEAGAMFLLSLVLGQIIFHYIVLLIDMMCFWAVNNQSGVLLVVFTQNLLSGSYAPLWYFPDWFQKLSSALPFQYTLNTPFSVYVGRLSVSEAARQNVIQVAWILMLAILARRLWKLAARQIVSQGG